MRIEQGSAIGAKSGFNEKDQILESIQKEITNLQEKLKRVEADENLTLEEKNEQKKLIYDQIHNLRQQYSQRELALIKEQQQQQSKVKIFTEDESDTEAVVLDGNLAAMMSADSALGTIRASRSLKTKLEAEENTLSGEIKLDAERGLGVAEKVEQRNELSEKIGKVMSFLADDVKQTQKAFDKAKEEEKDAKDEKKKNSIGHVDVLI
jgi:chromosome segregation ATPase